MHSFVVIGSAPCDEPCACLGEDHYRERALEECQRFIELLRNTFGTEPAGARFRVKWFLHDFGEYCEVVCSFNTDIPESAAYAYWCEDEAPATWEG